MKQGILQTFRSCEYGGGNPAGDASDETPVMARHKTNARHTYQPCG